MSNTTTIVIACNATKIRIATYRWSNNATISNTTTIVIACNAANTISAA